MCWKSCTTRVKLCDSPKSSVDPDAIRLSTVDATNWNSCRWQTQHSIISTIPTSYLEIVISRLEHLPALDELLELRHPLWLRVARYLSWIVLHDRQTSTLPSRDGPCHSYKVAEILRLVQSRIILDEFVEAPRGLGTCRDVFWIDFLKNPDQDVVA